MNAAAGSEAGLEDAMNRKTIALLSVAVMPLACAAGVDAAGKAAGPGEPPWGDAEPGTKYVYKTSGGAPRELEVYFPGGKPAAGKKVPGVILFHGGGWTGGDRGQFRNACRYFASRGLVAATVSYRMLQGHEISKLPAGHSHKRACVTDARSAIRWMKQHAGELGVDPARIIAGGGSAGGHIAVLASAGGAGLDDPADPAGFDTSVAAYVLFNPAFQAQDERDPEVDARQHLRADLPPAIVFFGDKDTWKPGWDEVYAKLKGLGNTTTELWIAPGKPHGFFNGQPWRNVTLAAADRFLVAHGLLEGECPLPPPPTGEKLVKAP